MNESLKSFIGKYCKLNLMTDDFETETYRIINVIDNSLIVENKKEKRIIYNIDYIVSVKLEEKF